MVILLVLCVIMLTLVVPASPILDRLLELVVHALLVVLNYYFASAKP
jgi:hypothetical protein